MAGRIKREQRTVGLMIGLYCRKHHGSPEGLLCEECAALRDYAVERLSRCPHGENKPTCRKCAIHCYRPDMKDRIREVMRYSGPRMMRHYPVAAMRHLFSEIL